MYYIFIGIVIFFINLFVGLMIMANGSFGGVAFIVIMAVDSTIIIFFIRQYLVEFRQYVEKRFEEKSNEEEIDEEEINEKIMS